MKEVMKTSLKIAIPIIFLVIGIFLGQDVANLSKIVNTSSEFNQQIQEEEIVVSLMLDYGDGRVTVDSSVVLSEDRSVFDLLQSVTKNNELEFSYNDQFKDMGIFVESINNVKNDISNDAWWHYWVNNKYGNIAADKLQLQNGDVVEWKFIKDKFKIIEN